MTVFALIPARGGSKGIPRKNIREIAGKPLIAWTIQAALAAPSVDAVVVSTEDAEIASVAREWGANVPFIRPVELSADETPGIDPVLHAIDMLPSYDAVLLLQPTSPLRTTADIEGILALAGENAVPAVVSVSKPEKHPNWMYRLGDGSRLEPLLPARVAARRQDLLPVYTLNGAMYFARTAWLRGTHGFLSEETCGYPMPAERSIDIDTPLDWRVAEMLLKDKA